MKRIYLDHAASSPLSKAALEKMLPYLTENYGNPSAIHAFGREAKRGVEEARGTIADVIGAHPDEIYFTSGGSESDSWAVMEGSRAKDRRMHVITSAVEHKAVLNSCRALEKQGFRVTYLAPDADGVIPANAVRDAIGENTGLVSVMTANNEIGTLQPIEEIGEICAERNVLFHTDAVQALGALPIRVEKMGVHLLSASAHKFHGPKGVGFLYIRRGVKLQSRIFGGQQEHGRRAGTENAAGIVGMAAALREAEDRREQNCAHMRFVRDAMLCFVMREIPGAHLNGSFTKRLPGNLNLRFDGIDAQALIMRLDMAGIAASAGSACMAGAVEVSHVLRAVGLDGDAAASSVRLTLSADTTLEEGLEAVRVLKENVFSMRLLCPSP